MKRKVDLEDRPKGSLEGLYTFAEVSKIYGIDHSTLRKQVRRGKFAIGVDVRKMGKTWIMTEQAMLENFGTVKFEEYINNQNEKEEKSKDCELM